MDMIVINHSVESPIGSKECRAPGLLLSCGCNTCNLSFFSSYRHGTLLAELSYLTFSLAILPFTAPKQATYEANRPILIAVAAVIRDETTRPSLPSSVLPSRWSKMPWNPLKASTPPRHWNECSFYRNFPLKYSNSELTAQVGQFDSTY